MNRFFSPVFVAQLNAEEKTLFDNFNSAVSAVEKPTVRLSCKQAGFSEKSLADSESFKQDPLYRLFLNWLALRAWAMSYEQEPITGAVTGDTWKEFRREYSRTKRLFCEVVEIGGKEPIQGSVLQNECITKAVISVQGILAIQKTLSPTANGLIIDLEVTLFFLLLTELDGVPVAQHVSVVNSTAVTAAPLLTCGNETSAWPKLSDVPSFRGGRKNNKDLCVGQIIGLLQFPQVPSNVKPTQESSLCEPAGYWVISYCV